MILYAKTTSERASKGQGGNEFLEIELTVGDSKNVIGHIYLDLHNDVKDHGDEENEWVLSWHQIDQDDPDIIAQGHIEPTKGERKKDETE